MPSVLCNPFFILDQITEYQRYEDLDLEIMGFPVPLPCMHLVVLFHLFWRAEGGSMRRRGLQLLPPSRAATPPRQPKYTMIEQYIADQHSNMQLQ